MSEEKYLQNYKKTLFESPLLTVDAVLFTYHQGDLKVLLIERSNHPEKGKWALPGGFVDEKKDRSLEDTVIRILKQKTSVEPPYIEQLYTFGGPDRDKRGWSVTISYTALIAHQACRSHIETVSNVDWVNVARAEKMELAFDHQQILYRARERLRQKALYSIVPAYALPETFTLPELQRVHEVIIGKPLQKKSFRRRIEQANLLIDTGEKRSEGGRPAALYRMREKSGDYTFVRNLEQ
ncbi:NUDIX hydrolase [Microbulbifer thermotolerans]|uniref:NUDIX hydrolase n=1 Tax=Microbulbifer thermotolerans TaxID=252514 RepID=A0AB35HU82_MICTH|nr:NUDIX domain-containing protein [Microbulbifer thermotolerans]MCX2779705.1 NUDIX hydrolase [Microbulbifer thermotolerans]MCX2782363.1 NUDIX hydrolase [Microbulbifer thermotolerans]MCX2794952.1 NUDIX hydrolase [Microbulbifer thermotolerans]MCX2800516.1 NUDIX hydrolase [Microbulbifer thermotolerans]MCX2805124.1 NUDIX hydrolase [Microbulbifer thermotolerans]